ncbi:TetR/AcrR family transcriptional regulator [Glutamicibacter sp.]|jgi:Transcriptional regulator|uniref:TetR/AcrR family transcriptional regulator n=1 Tax=Glutamicibacter sp. TaxID=1931995 RepID=UPI002B4696B9|nr:TetR/AcrR family transcriptional regulator [Glutamicibacter sp.]HJX79011.1 TetR/AcrR family transcriptional regulator [Glutamicibacter sp.]
MPPTVPPLGRRERNKQAKLERIITAASELFAAHGVDDVTTGQIADAADIGTGTLFLYAKTKGELLLLVQNRHYAKALEEGQKAAGAKAEALDAVMALIAPIVECNRVQVQNGRTYLREMLFGDPTEEHHGAALNIVRQTEHALAELLYEHLDLDRQTAATLAQVISSIQYVSMASAMDPDIPAAQLTAAIRAQIGTVLGR